MQSVGVPGHFPFQHTSPIQMHRQVKTPSVSVPMVHGMTSPLQTYRTVQSASVRHRPTVSPPPLVHRQSASPPSGIGFTFVPAATPSTPYQSTPGATPSTPYQATRMVRSGPTSCSFTHNPVQSTSFVQGHSLSNPRSPVLSNRVVAPSLQHSGLGSSRLPQSLTRVSSAAPTVIENSEAPCPHDKTVCQEPEEELPFDDEVDLNAGTRLNAVKTGWGRVPTEMIPPVRTAEDDPLPPEDALKQLKEGNNRFVNGTALAVRTSNSARQDLHEYGQCPHSAIIGCADSRCPIDMMFDAMPGDLFVLRNAGNTCTHAEGSIVGSLEYCIDHLKSRLILVLGHTKCGAIAGATKTYMATKSKGSNQAQSSLEGLLSGLRSVAHQAAEELNEDADVDRIAAHAVTVNVFHTMSFLMQFSKSIREKVISGEVQVHGGVYELDTGRVNFLGPSPMQQQLLTSQLTVPPSFAGAGGSMMRGVHGIRTTADEILSPVDAMKALKQGNSRYVAGVPLASSTNDAMRKALNDLGQAPHTAIVGCADSRCPVDTVFDCMPGELFVLRNAGNTCTHAEGATVGSLEYCVGNLKTKLILVLGHTNCGAIAGATQLYLASKSKPQAAGGLGSALDILLQDLGSVAKQAESDLGEGASPQEIAKLAVRVNVFSTIDFLLKFSKSIRNKVVSGELEVHGGIYNLETGIVDFLGASPKQAEVIASQMLLPPSMASKAALEASAQAMKVRTARDSAIPPEEAVKLLQEGNERYATGTPWARNTDPSMRRALLEHGQAPHAAIVGCADSRCPIETMFDAMPGELFVLRNAGNTCLHAEGSLVGSLEYCVQHLKTRLIMVVGHTKCGAIQAATQAYLAGEQPGQIGLVSNSLDCLLKDVSEVAKHAANELGVGATPDDIASHAVKVNVFQTMNFLLKYSPHIRDKVRLGQVQIQGGIYHLDTGRVEFLGKSPAQHVLVSATGMLPPSLDSRKEVQSSKSTGEVQSSKSTGRVVHAGMGA